MRIKITLTKRHRVKNEIEHPEKRIKNIKVSIHVLAKSHLLQQIKPSWVFKLELVITKREINIKIGQHKH